ncbi:MAG: hypothetical protein ACE5HW_05150 [Candidatus Methanofastidiosia archaeon]
MIQMKKLSVLIICILIVSTLPIEVSAQRQSISDVVISQGGKRRVIVNYYPGSESWAKEMIEVAQKGFPLLEEMIGEQCPISCDIIITEIRPDSLGPGIWGENRGCEGLFFPNDFTALALIHELAHYWFTSGGNRWITEGFPDAYAWLVGQKIGFEEDYEEDWLRSRRTWKVASYMIGDLP